MITSLPPAEMVLHLGSGDGKQLWTCSEVDNEEEKPCSPHAL